MKALSLTVFLCAAGLSVQAQTPLPPAPPQQPPTFRSGTLIVPLDVRVTDRNGKPITDLTAADFTVTEDRVPQRITQFVQQVFEAGEPTPLTYGARFAYPDVAAPLKRTFLLVLGRGRLQHPGKGADGALHFVKNNLLPQDHVAVLAWDRATPFTTDHKKIVAVLERFKDKHEGIEATLESLMSGLAGAYGTRDFPPSVRSAIDGVFAEDGIAAPDTTVSNATALQAREWREIAALQDAQVASTRKVNTEIVSEADATGVAGGFDEYVKVAVQTTQDLMGVYRGIEYLKYLDGEKQLIYFSPRGFTLPDTEDDRSLAATAADARVVMNFIITGGTNPTGWSWPNSTAQRVSELTGGYFTSVSYATKAVDRITAMAQQSYVLGYTPSNTTWDLKYRKVEVRVNRPGARVYYRHGYFARPSRPPMDMAAVLSLTRISAASRIGSSIPDIGLTNVFASPATGPNGARQVLVEVHVSAAQLTFGEEAGRRTAKFDLAVFIGDEQNLLVGQTWQTVELKVEPERYARFLQQGIPVTLRVPIRRSSRNAKVIVYDYGSDLMGSVAVKVKNKPK
jgi:VWFA-related protein